MTRFTLRLALFGALAAALLAARPSVRAEEAPAAKINYNDHVKPILREHCFSCHNQDNAKSDLALDSYAALMRGGAGGEVVLAGELDSSRLWGLVSHSEEPKMPPNQDKLAEAKLDVIKNWIVGGALESAGSTAKKSNKPKLSATGGGGSHRPEGPPPLPENLSREVVVYTPKATAVTAIATSPWAPLAAIAGQKQILLYQTDTAELLGVLPFPEGIPHVLKFSRNGSLLLAGGGRAGQSGKVVVFDVKTGERAFEIGDELDVVLAADINDDHTRVALGGPGRVVRIFNTEDGSVVSEIRKHTEWIYSVEFSPDGVLLATADRNGDVFVWEAETGREYQNLKGHTAAVCEVSWRLDSNILATASQDGTVKMWEMENGQPVKSWAAHGNAGVEAVRFTHDGRLVTAGRDRVVRVWNADASAGPAFEAFGDLALRTAFTHDGGRVVAGDWTGEIRVWNVADTKLVAHLAMNPPTLEMVAAATAAEAQAADAAQKAADAELLEIAKQLAALTDGLQKAPAEVAALDMAAGTTAAEKAAAEKAAADADAVAKTAAEQFAAAKAALEKAEADKAATAKALAEKDAAAKSAAEQAAAKNAAAEAMTAQKPTLEQALVEKAHRAREALAKAAAAKAAAEKAAADKAAAEQQKSAQQTAQAAK
ncbi:MAG: hypothetical protein JNG90_16000 [Planctomycetaceae bacterium]|nr:hypothetical protein [Planctomycetaceae bacterium]